MAKPAEFNLAKYKTHKGKIEELIGTKAILNLDKITSYQRKVLIKENILFIVKDNQISLPFLAVFP